MQLECDSCLFRRLAGERQDKKQQSKHDQDRSFHKFLLVRFSA
jgi:hypothetical protein